MIAYEETYASLAQSLLDGIAKQHPSSKHIMDILATLKQEADNDDHPITTSILNSTKIGNKLFETVKACRQQMQSASDDASRGEWDRAMNDADALLWRFREAGNEESGKKPSAGTSSMPKTSAHIDLDSKKKNSGNKMSMATKKQAHEPVSAAASAASANYMMDEQHAGKQLSASTSRTTQSFEEILCSNSSNILSTCISLPTPSSKLVLDTLSSLSYAIHNNDNKLMTMEILKGTNIGDAMAHTVQKCEEMKRKMLATNLNATATEEYNNWEKALKMAGAMVNEFIMIAKAEPKQLSASSPMDEKKLTQIELQKTEGIPAGRKKEAYEPTSSLDDVGWVQHNNIGMGQDTADYYAGNKQSSSSLSSVKKKSSGKLKQPPRPTTTSTAKDVGESSKSSMVPWECTKCSHINTRTKSKCGSCNGWKGGKRTSYKNAAKVNKKDDDTAHSKVDEKAHDQSSPEVIVIDDEGQEERPKRKLKSVARFADTQSLRDDNHLHSSHKIADGFACPNCMANNPYDSTECHLCTFKCYYEAGVGVVTLKERNEISGSPMKKRQRRGKSKGGGVEASLANDDRKTPPENHRQSLAYAKEQKARSDIRRKAANLGWERKRKRKSQEMAAKIQGEQQRASTTDSIREKAAKLARETRQGNENSATVADEETDDRKRSSGGSKRTKKTKHAKSTVAPGDQSDHERRREAAKKAWATRRKNLARTSDGKDEVKLEEGDREQPPEALSPKKPRRTSIIGPVEYAKKMKSAPKKVRTEDPGDNESENQLAQVAEADGNQKASTKMMNSTSKGGENDDHDSSFYCQPMIPAKFNGFSEDTLPRPHYKRAQRVYAKDDSTGLLYPAMVRKVLWGPKSDRNSMGCVSLTVDGKPSGPNNDNPNVNDYEEEDEGSRRWNPKYNCWHYYVHYMGWAIRWDRWAEERFIYEDSASSEALAKTLMTEYNKLKPKKRNQKMSLNQCEKWMKRMVQIEEEHNKAASSHDVEHGELHSEHFPVSNIEPGVTNEKLSDPTVDATMEDAQETKEKETSDDAKLRPAKKLGVETLQLQAKLRESGLQVKRKKSISDRLLLPFNLKKVLVEEWEVITQCDSVHNLPAKVTVRDALNHYLESKLAPLRKKAMGRDVADNDQHAVLGKEWIDMVEGIALFFDQALRPHLLYAEERSQYNCLRRQIINQRRISMEMKGTQPKGAEDMSDKASDLAMDVQPPRPLPERMSEIYGCEFLLRLFVRLPGVVAESAISETQSRRIFSKLGDLIRYLPKHQGELVCSSFRRPLPNEIRANKLSGN